MIGGAAIHPLSVEAPAQNGGGGPQQGGNINGLPFFTGTARGLALRALQMAAAVAGLMILTLAPDFVFILPLRFLFWATVVQGVWSMVTSILDTYALIVMRSLQNTPVLLCLFLGDLLVASVLFPAASMSGGVALYIATDLNNCKGHSCAPIQIATVVSMFTCFLLSSSMVLNFWVLVTLWIAE